jgi:hypothetical protein
LPSKEAATVPGKKKATTAAEHLGSVLDWLSPYYTHNARMLAEAGMKTKWQILGPWRRRA